MPASRCAGMVALLSMLLTGLCALAVLQAQGPSFRSGVDLVPLDVCVTGHDGRYLPALTRDDFVIFENRVPQDLAFFSAEGELPLTAVVLIDRSSSMTGSSLDRAKAAATTFLHTLTDADHASVLAFNESTSRIAAFGEPDATSRPVGAVRAHGQTALFDAVLVALRELETRRSHSVSSTREAIVILSDGEDSASRNDFEEVHRAVQRAGVIVYSISIRADERGRTLPPLHEFAQLANDSGGRVIALDDWTALDTIYADIAAELRHMYRLAYVPSGAKSDGLWRALTVRVPNYDVRVRTRAGYFATRPVPGRDGR